MFVGSALYGFYLGNEKQFLAVGGEGETFNVSIVLRELFAFRTVGVHFPYLAAAAFVAKEGNLLAVLNPGGLAFLPVVTGNLPVVAAVGIHDEQFIVTLVFRYTVIGYRIGYLLLVGRYGYATDTPHCPKRFGGHTLTFNPDVRFPDKRVILSCFFRSAAGCQHDCCRHK